MKKEMIHYFLDSPTDIITYNGYTTVKNFIILIMTGNLIAGKPTTG